MWNFPMPLPLWVATKAEGFSAAVNPEGQLCCFLFTSRDKAEAFAKSKFPESQIRSVHKDELRAYLAVAKARGVTHVILDHKSAIDFKFDIDELLAGLGAAPAAN